LIDQRCLDDSRRNMSLLHHFVCLSFSLLLLTKEQRRSSSSAGKVFPWLRIQKEVEVVVHRQWVMSFIIFGEVFFLFIYPPPGRSTISSLAITHVLSFPLGFCLSLALCLSLRACSSFVFDVDQGSITCWAQDLDPCEAYFVRRCCCCCC
jgi:hypothetical protein